jgi:hypothetical protein
MSSVEELALKDNPDKIAVNPIEPKRILYISFIDFTEKPYLYEKTNSDATI